MAEFLLTAIGFGMGGGLLCDGIGQLWQSFFNCARHKL